MRFGREGEVLVDKEKRHPPLHRLRVSEGGEEEDSSKEKTQAGLCGKSDCGRI